MKQILIIAGVLSSMLAFAQPAEYFPLIRKADSLYKEKQFTASATTYSKAFKTFGWKGLPTDRYNAGCSYALAGNSDSAFFQLERITTRVNFASWGQVLKDTDFNSLHTDKRWDPLIAKMKANNDRIMARYNRPVMRVLDSIREQDQKYRLMMDNVEKEFGRNSQEMKNVWKAMGDADSTNLIVVTDILEKYGWLGSEEVGDTGNGTLFLVIQHADIKTQEKYLPLMREAVKSGKASAGSLALLEDRVALRQGKKQIYGSQIARDNATGKYFISPIEDEPNVNKRRAAVGLEPLEIYVKRWDIEYKLPEK